MDYYFRRITQNCEYIETFCNDRRNPFHFACRKWYLYNNPQCDVVKLQLFKYK